MKKIICAIAMLLLLQITTIAQEREPVPKMTTIGNTFKMRAEWEAWYFNQKLSPIAKYYATFIRTYKFVSEEEFNGKTYAKIVFVGDNWPPNKYDPDVVSYGEPSHGVFYDRGLQDPMYYREEDDKIYRYFPEEKFEVEVFDYNIKVGDEIPVWSWYNEREYRKKGPQSEKPDPRSFNNCLRLDSIREIEMAGRKRREYNFSFYKISNSTGELFLRNSPKKFVEGMGFVEGDGSYSGGSFLTCFSMVDMCGCFPGWIEANYETLHCFTDADGVEYPIFAENESCDIFTTTLANESIPSLEELKVHYRDGNLYIDIADDASHSYYLCSIDGQRISDIHSFARSTVLSINLQKGNTYILVLDKKIPVKVVI